ncbi:MAG: hypothetical protein AYP45_11545 [Candidatus Brocadia carolinensis]|uniref:Uncharacterized protein n=1 Tax=Candidatus Brocadia carolinensis TaxID=1004156 RepID=A0A1V4AS64_9BACT|nr:MAG: hypothetical protein AYP45_11545 [Candidatus Brocadia caroliniensis]
MHAGRSPTDEAEVAGSNAPDHSGRADVVAGQEGLQITLVFLEVRTFLKQFSLVTAYTGGNDVRKAEANTKGSIAHCCRA